MAKLAPITIPTLAETSPAYASLADRKAGLAAQRRALELEADELRFTLTNAKPDKGRSARVGALLGDDVESIVDPASRIREIDVEIADIRAAITELEARMRAERSAASKAICAGVRGQYAASVAAVARGLIAAHVAHRDLTGMIARLNTNDVAWTGELAPMQATRVIGAANDNQSPLARYLQEAAALGFIDISEVPEELD